MVRTLVSTYVPLTFYPVVALSPRVLLLLLLLLLLPLLLLLLLLLLLPTFDPVVVPPPSECGGLHRRVHLAARQHLVRGWGWGWG